MFIFRKLFLILSWYNFASPIWYQVLQITGKVIHKIIRERHNVGIFSCMKGNKDDSNYHVDKKIGTPHYEVFSTQSPAKI